MERISVEGKSGTSSGAWKGIVTEVFPPGPRAGEICYAADPTPIGEPGTVPELFFRSALRVPEHAALLYKSEGEYRPVSYRDLAERVRAFGRTLMALGIRPGDRVGLLSENRPEWAIADLATLAAGAATVAIYPTLTPPQVRDILRDAGARFLVVSDRKMLDKALSVRDDLPELAAIVAMEPAVETATDPRILSFQDLLASGRSSSVGEEELEARWRSVRPDHLASLIYTSGTTGEPKGARLTHNNFVSNASAIFPVIDLNERDLFLSFLPLCHVFARLGDHYLPLSAGATIAYTESLFTVQKNMEEVRPTFMLSVPRLYESMQSRIVDAASKAPPMKKRLFDWALSVGRKHHRDPRERGWAHALEYAAADRLVLSKIRAKMGGRLRHFISGGAPLPRETAEFFSSIGLALLEGYGLTETSPVICVNRPDGVKHGTVGPPLPGVEVRIAQDGEILTRGPHVMEGYHGKPEETRQAIDAEDWFHTGDIGRLDSMGRLTITDRKKEIIVLANGKNVAPQPIETALKASPYISDVALIGDRRNVITALIAPSMEALKRHARSSGMGTMSPEDLAKDAEIRKLIKQEIDRLTSSFADFERIHRFTLLDHEFTQESGLLTPTLKLKRRLIADRYEKEISAMYGGGE